MSGNSSLRAAVGRSIVLVHEVIVIELSAEASQLPFLDLGLIGDDYETVPASLKVNPPDSLSREELRAYSHEVISGTTLSNCEDWQHLLELTSNSFTSVCESGEGGKLLSGVRSLVIKGVLTDTPSSSPDPGLSPGEIVAIVIGVVAAVALAVGGGIYFFKKKQKVVQGSLSGSGGE
jgi:hypothetical protein